MFTRSLTRSLVNVASRRMFAAAMPIARTSPSAASASVSSSSLTATSTMTLHSVTRLAAPPRRCFADDANDVAYDQPLSDGTVDGILSALGASLEEDLDDPEHEGACAIVQAYVDHTDVRITPLRKGHFMFEQQMEGLTARFQVNVHDINDIDEDEHEHDEEFSTDEDGELVEEDGDPFDTAALPFTVELSRGGESLLTAYCSTGDTTLRELPADTESSESDSELDDMSELIIEAVSAQPNAALGSVEPEDIDESRALEFEEDQVVNVTDLTDDSQVLLSDLLDKCGINDDTSQFLVAFSLQELGFRRQQAIGLLADRLKSEGGDASE